MPKKGQKLIETTGAEVLPIALRSRVMGLAAASHFIVNVGITEAGPSAFSHVSFLCYYKQKRRKNCWWKSIAD
jgi:hypothetical protein